MADKTLLSQMLEHLVNDDQAKAEELFHEYVVSASREIYENLIESEISEEEKEEDEDEEVDEASEEDKDEDDKVDEEFEDIAYEGDDEMDLDSEDPMDDLAGEMGPEEGEAEEKSEEELFQDLDYIVEELQDKFDELKGHEEGEHEMDGDSGEEEMPGEAFDLATVREYVEKVPAGHGAEKKGAAEKADNTKSTIDNMKNDMGGTTANILSSKEEAATFAGQGQLKGNGLLKGTAKEDNAGNINVPGGKAGGAFSKKEPGHGAEKAGSKESADNKQSLFRGRR